MSSYQQHCDECRKQLGQDWGVVHHWLDEFFVKMGYHVRHRDIRHHKAGIEEVRKLWGDQAAEAARIHMEMDFNGWIPANSDEVQKWRIGLLP